MSADPSVFVAAHLHLIEPRGEVLDLACGSGRHTRLLLDHGFNVTAVDVDAAAIANLPNHPRLVAVNRDLEDGSEWNWAGRYHGVVVTNYLHRPTLALLPTLLHAGGILIYETFMVGNEAFGRPHNPDYLLQEDELLDTFEPMMEVVAFEQCYIDLPKPAMVQRFCGRLRRLPASSETIDNGIA